MVHVLEPYDVHTFQCRIYHGTSKVRVDNKTIHTFRTDLPVQSSNLLSYAVAHLILCSYINLKTTIFNPTGFSVSIFIFQNPRRYENGQKCLKYAQNASHTACTGTEDHDSQREHERINQNDQRQPLKMTTIVVCHIC